MRVMDLKGWVPQSGGAFKSGNVFPMSAEQVTIEKILRVMDDHVSFTCDFGGRSEGYDFFVPDKKTANKIAKILNDNVGKTLFSIGFMELPPDQD